MENEKIKKIALWLLSMGFRPDAHHMSMKALWDSPAGALSRRRQLHGSFPKGSDLHSVRKEMDQLSLS